MILKSDSCTWVPIRMKNETWVKRAIEKLTRKGKSFADVEEEEIKLYYGQVKTHILLPRFYAIPYDVQNISKPGEAISVNSNIKPRNPKQEIAMDWMHKNRNGLLCMQPGEGKTVITIEAICRIGEKTIIFVHKNGLGAQWIERIVEHTEMEADRVGWLRSAHWKADLQRPIIVATVQTFCSLIKTKGIEFIREVRNAKFGMAIWDECHTSISAEQFSKTSLYTPAYRYFGLSATPDRTDGNTDIMSMHLGETFIPEGEAETLTPKVIMIYIDHEIMKKYKYRVHQLYLKEGNKNRGRFSKGTYLKWMWKSEKYIDVLKNIVKQIDESGRYALILSERINVLETVRKVVKNQKRDSSLYVGSMTDNERMEMLKKRMIFSTYLKSRDGTDVPRLDSIVFCSPVSNIDQAVGRIVRTCEGKSMPVVIDIVDSGCEEMKDRSKYRRKFYDEKGWTVEEKILK